MIPQLGANPPSISDLAELRCRELPFGCRTLTANSLNLRDGNTVIVNYYQAGSSRYGIGLITAEITDTRTVLSDTQWFILISVFKEAIR